MRFVYQAPDAAGLATVARVAEDAGWDGLAVAEHPAPSAAWLASGGYPTLDPFVALAYAAAVTTRIRLLTYLVVLPYRNPALLAKTAATLDVVSGGRLTLGVGAGYMRSEFRALGVEFDERNELLDEALDVLPLHWSGEPFGYTGRHFECRSTVGVPAAVQQPIPIWIGGNSMHTLARVAARAQGWMPLLAPPSVFPTVRSPQISTDDDLRTRLGGLRRLAGDRFATLDVVVPYHDADTHALTEPARHRERVAELAEMGVTWLAVAGPPDDRQAAFAAQFAEHVILPLRPVEG